MTSLYLVVILICIFYKQFLKLLIRGALKNTVVAINNNNMRTNESSKWFRRGNQIIVTWVQNFSVLVATIAMWDSARNWRKLSWKCFNFWRKLTFSWLYAVLQKNQLVTLDQGGSRLLLTLTFKKSKIYCVQMVVWLSEDLQKRLRSHGSFYDPVASELQ